MIVMFSAAPTIAKGLDDIVDRYGVFLVDQFGVLHDGMKPYPGAVDALRELSAAGKTVILLSNSGKRSAPNSERLNRLGFAREQYLAILTSGEVAWNLLKEAADAGTIPAGARCLLFSRDNDSTAIDGLGLERAIDGNVADVIVLSGSRSDEFDIEYYRYLLRPAAGCGVPCYCTNPDKIMLTPVGPRFGTGIIADEYAKMGGPVHWIGKPFHDIYEHALKLAGNPALSDVCCIGDSVEHDIAGGVGVGLATALVTSGILSGAGEDRLEPLYRKHNAGPNHILDRFAFETGDEA